MSDDTQLVADLERQEGFESKPYLDSQQKWTRGIGEHDGITANSAPVTYDQAVANLKTRLAVARDDARSVIGAEVFDAMDQVRQDAVIDLAYNMGKPTLAQFVPMLEFIRKGDFPSAGFHLLVNTSSHLQKYLIQVGERAVEIALRIATGVVLPEHKI